MGGAGHSGGPGQKDVSQAVVREKLIPTDNLSHELPAHGPYWAAVTFKGHSLLLPTLHKFSEEMGLPFVSMKLPS